jgi:lipid-A-disaccharide synthase
MTAHAVFGLTEVLKQVGKFRRIGRELLALAVRRQPDVIVLVDYAGFNRRFAAAVRRRVRALGPFGNWRPRIVYYVSPQVWASRPGRALQLERDVDLLLSIVPFEKAWYARRVPRLRVEFVGHPLVDRHRHTGASSAVGHAAGQVPLVLLLPGSRIQEVRRHLPVMVEAVRILRRSMDARYWMVLPDEGLLGLAQSLAPVQLERTPGEEGSLPETGEAIGCSVGGLSSVLARSDLAIASSGTVTMECAWFRVPTVVIYRVAWPTFWVAERLVKVPFIAMPNLLAGEALYPELLQEAASGEGIAREGLVLLRDAARREKVVLGLERVIQSLGEPGACGRAAEAVAGLLGMTKARA